MYLVTAVITGRQGSFPLDMLRYDACFPVDSEAVDAINNGDRWREPSGERKWFAARIGRYVSRKDHGFTIGRWESFGCTVSNVRVQKI